MNFLIAGITFTKAWILLLITIGSILLTFLILSCLLKIRIFCSLKSDSEKKQLPQLIKQKFFISADGYKLKWRGEIKAESQTIILGLHEWGFDSQNFNIFQDYCQSHREFSFVSYDQRNSGENEIEMKPNLGNSLEDLKIIVDWLKKQYPQKEIVLLTEGYGWEIARYVAFKETKIKKIIVLGINNRELYRRVGKIWFRLIRGILFSPYTWLPFVGEGADLSNNPEFIKKINRIFSQKPNLTVREYYQKRQLSKYNQRRGFRADQKLLIFQGENDVYTNLSKTMRLLKTIDQEQIKIDYWKNSRHFLVNEPDAPTIIKALINWLKTPQDDKNSNKKDIIDYK